jgi:hypothetical protein
MVGGGLGDVTRVPRLEASFVMIAAGRRVRCLLPRGNESPLP